MRNFGFFHNWIKGFLHLCLLIGLVSWILTMSPTIDFCSSSWASLCFLLTTRFFSGKGDIGDIGRLGGNCTRRENPYDIVLWVGPPSLDLHLHRLLHRGGDNPANQFKCPHFQKEKKSTNREKQKGKEKKVGNGSRRGGDSSRSRSRSSNDSSNNSSNSSSSTSSSSSSSLA